jgi:hypothetical protein
VFSTSARIFSKKMDFAGAFEKNIFLKKHFFAAFSEVASPNGWAKFDNFCCILFLSAALATIACAPKSEKTGRRDG